MSKSQIKEIKNKVENILGTSLASIISELSKSNNEYERTLGVIISEGIKRHLPRHELDSLIYTYIENLGLLDEETENKLYAIENIIFSISKTYDDLMDEYECQINDIEMSKSL